MEYVLTKSKLTSAMFDGRGYLVSLRDNKERRTIMSAVFSGVEMYMSRDAVEVIRRWIRMWELQLEGNEDFKFLNETLHFGEIKFVLYDRADYGFADIKTLKDIEPQLFAEIFTTARDNFTTGFDEATWHKQNDHFAPYAAESYNVPGRMMQFNYDNDGATYNYRLINQAPPVPYVTRDLAMIRMADALLGIANTQSYPQGGYKLNLQLAFGSLDLAEMTRDGLREMAERLIP